MRKLIASSIVGLIFAPLSVSQVYAQSCDVGSLNPSIRQISGDEYRPSQISATRVSFVISFEGEIAECDALPILIRGSNTTTLPRAIWGGSAAPLNVAWRMSEAALDSKDQWKLSVADVSSLTNGEDVTVHLLEINSGQYVSPGQFLVNLTLEVSEQTFDFDAVIEVLPDLNFVGTARRTINLGDIRFGSEGQSSFIFQTNATVDVKIRSEYQGTLQHSKGAEFGAIPYRAFVNGNELFGLNQEAGTKVALSSAGSMTGTLKVVVEGDVVAYAGDYEDIITISFAPQ